MTTTDVSPTEQLAGRFLEAGIGAFELTTALLGERLGL